MTYADQRLAELDALSRKRALTLEEQREVMLRARQSRRNLRRRSLYWLDPAYRQRRIETNGRARA